LSQLRGVLRRFERNCDKALGRQAAVLVRLSLLHDADQVRCIGLVASSQIHAHAVLVRPLVKAINAIRVEPRRTGA